MKKTIVAIIFISLLVFPVFASSETSDVSNIPFSNLTTEDLQLVIHLAREELAKRNLKEKESMVIVDTEDFLVYLDGDPVVKDSSHGKELEFYIVVENRSSSSQTLLVNNVYVNRWKVAAYHLDLSLDAGKRVKSSMQVYDLINSVDELEEIEFDFGVWNNELREKTVESIKKTIVWE